MDENTTVIIGGVISIVAIVVGYFVLFKKKSLPTVFPLDEFQKFPLIRKQNISHDTRKFTFGLPEGHVLGLPTGQHVSLRFVDKDGKSQQRSYTPVTDNTSVGEFSLVTELWLWKCYLGVQGR